MNHSSRAAKVLTLALGYGALWVAFVTTGGEPIAVEGGALLWMASILSSVVLMGALFLTARFLACGRRNSGRMERAGNLPALSTVVAALVTVGALLGLVPSLRVALWGGPSWLRWGVVAIATGGVMIGSGRAMTWAVLGGIVWALVGVWSGAHRDVAARVDLILTMLMVGTSLGAVLGTLWGWHGDPKGH